MVQPPRYLTIKLIADLAEVFAPWVLLVMLPLQALTSFLIGLCRRPVTTFFDNALLYIFVLSVSVHQSMETGGGDPAASNLVFEGVFFSVPFFVYLAGYSIRLILMRVIRNKLPPKR